MGSALSDTGLSCAMVDATTMSTMRKRNRCETSDIVEKKLTKEKDSKSPREKKRKREKKAPKVQKLQQCKGYMSESTQERKSTDDVPTQHKW